MVLATGYTALMGANVVFWTSSGVGGMLAGWLLVGLHMGLTHSLIGTTLQSYAPDKLAGTAFRCGADPRGTGACGIEVPRAPTLH